MNFINKFNISKDEVLNSLNFIKFSDAVFAASMPISDFNKMYKLNEVYIISKTTFEIVFIKKEICIKEGSLIFCNTDFIPLLFKCLSKIEGLKNINILSGQSDSKVSSKLYNKKPDCVSKWYAVNANIIRKNLVSIPLGIANQSYEKNIVYKDFEAYKNVVVEKEEKLYINFNLNTNYFHRLKASKLSNFKNSYVEYDKSSKRYLYSIHKYKYVLCPWGNGYETHRFWETLYSGSIPVTKANNIYKQFNQFPIILLNKYNLKELINKINKHKFTNFNPEVLKTSWWFKNIIDNSKVGDKKFDLIIDEESFNIFNSYYKNKIRRIGYLKKINTFIRKFYSKLCS